MIFNPIIPWILKKMIPNSNRPVKNLKGRSVVLVIQCWNNFLNVDYSKIAKEKSLFISTIERLKKFQGVCVMFKQFFQTF